MPEHSAARRLRKISDQNPDNFDARAKDNVDKVAKLHEFRGPNIREYEAPEKDFFDYDPEEQSRKYDAAKLESIFRHDQTFKAMKWGCSVGALFAMHRYYRTRSIENASYWFATMSLLSSTNIFISYGL